MDLAELPPIQGSTGTSLVPQMALAKDPNRAVPTFLYDQVGIRKGRYRFIRYGDGVTRLYDLAEDWWQTRDLGPDHPAHTMMAAALSECCRAYSVAPGALRVA